MLKKFAAVSAGVLLAAVAASGTSTAQGAQATQKPWHHTSTVCATTTAHGPVAKKCPPASVYTKWAHQTYSSNSRASAGTITGNTVSPNASWVCTIYVSDLSLAAGDISGETANTCSGSFLYQYIGEQVWRSSWSGWRGYDSWGYTEDVYSDYADFFWYIGCKGGGTYNYIQVAYGAVNDGSGAQAGPQTRSLNSKRWTCGPSA